MSIVKTAIKSKVFWFITKYFLMAVFLHTELYY